MKRVLVLIVILVLFMVAAPQVSAGTNSSLCAQGVNYVVTGTATTTDYNYFNFFAVEVDFWNTGIGSQIWVFDPNLRLTKSNRYLLFMNDYCTSLGECQTQYSRYRPKCIYELR
jgi:hypothetical protein